MATATATANSLSLSLESIATAFSWKLVMLVPLVISSQNGRQNAPCEKDAAVSVEMLIAVIVVKARLIHVVKENGRRYSNHRDTYVERIDPIIALGHICEVLLGIDRNVQQSNRTVFLPG
jgi:hypothetical protein